MAASSYPTDTKFNGPIIVDPLTRVEGHLRIEVEVTAGKVSKAYSSATLFRGLEMILKGRDPRDTPHFTQRACGVCTYTHALCSTRALDNALKVEIPPLARMIRNLVLAEQIMHDHVVHFYHLHALDFVDVTNGLKADPAKAAKLASTISSRQTTTESLKAVQDRIKKYVDSGQLGHLTNAPFLGGHPAYVLEPEMDLIATAHYLEALELQTKIARAMAVFGGKNPHPQFLVIGGVTCYDSLKPEKVKQFMDLHKDCQAFINEVYLADIIALGAAYKDVATYGGTTNFITFGEFRTDENKTDTGFFKPGVIYDRNLKNIAPVDPAKIAEHVRHSWYKGAEAKHPYEGVTDPAYTDLHGDDRYSFAKAPRYDGKPMETGPLANVLAAYATGHPTVVPIVDKLLKTLNAGPEALFSTLGRTAARAIHAAVIANQVDTWFNEFTEQLAKEKEPKLIEPWEMPDKAEGVGFVGAPRGGLSHWLRIEDKKIANFQLVVPTTWNGGPRCANDLIGPFEESLMGVPIADPKRPVEILRTIHSYDPCLACAVHVIDPESNEERVFKIL